MRIRVHFSDGRDEEFDTSALTVSGALGKTSAMGDFELSMRDDGLWVVATWYDAAAARESGGIARRAPGCSIHLLDAAELAQVETIFNGDKAIFRRVGPDLMDMVRYEQAINLYFESDDVERASIARRIIRLLGLLKLHFPDSDEEERLAMMGMTEASFQILSGADANVDGGMVYFEEG